MIARQIKTTINKHIHSIVHHYTHSHQHELQSMSYQLLRKQHLATSTILKHCHLNRAYSANLAANALFGRLRDDASKSNVVELTFQDMVEYSRKSQLFINTANFKNGTNGNGHKNGEKSLCSLQNEAHLIESADYVRKQLAIIIARIIIDFQNLPYGVANNPRIDQIMQTYIDSFIAIKQIPTIKSLSDKKQFHETLEKFLSSWTQAVVVPNLCLGLLEMAQQKSLQKIEECPYLSNFIDRIITRRLAARVLLGHYMALHNNQWGILERKCAVIEHIENAKNDALSIANKIYDDDKLYLPKIKIIDMRKNKMDKNNKGSEFIFCGKMLHQFVYELLKNSIRATMEFHGEDAVMNDINVIVINSNDGDVTIKVADTGGGISRSESNKIWLYSYTTARYSKKYRVEKKKVNKFKKLNGECDEDSLSQIELLHKTIKIDKYSVTHNPYYIGAVLHDNIPMYGLGYGLPLVKAYSQYFGGSCKIHSIDGYGTDAYLFLPTLSKSQSNVLSVD